MTRRGGTGNEENLGFVLVATIPSPSGPAPNLSRAQTHHDRNGDHARLVAVSISLLRGDRSGHAYLSVLHASGAKPFTFWASAMSTSQPWSSKVSWTKRAPVIDSMTAWTGPP